MKSDISNATKHAFKQVAEDHKHSIYEVSLFNFLFVIQVTYIAYFIRVEGISEFISYFSCWNYLFNAVYFLIICLGMRKWVYIIALLLTPFALAINTVWVTLTGLIVVLGAPFEDDNFSSSTSCDFMCTTEMFLGIIYCHVAPMIASVVYFVLHFNDLRKIYRRTNKLTLKKMSTWSSIGLCFIIMWLPWFAFLVYTLVYDPEKRYGYKKPSFAVMTVIEAIMLLIYSAVIGGVMFLTYTTKFEMGSIVVVLLGKF
jgi:hypothetical protein